MSKIQQKQELRQRLNPKQILEASLFQLNSFALEQRIYSELEKNPLLELLDPIDTDEDIMKGGLWGLTIPPNTRDRCRQYAGWPSAARHPHQKKR